MRSRTFLVALAVSAFSVSVSSVAAAGAPAAATTRSGRIAATDSTRIRALMMQADASMEAGRISEARRLYRTLINEQQAADQYPGAALWRLAEAFFYSDDVRGAARALDDAAEAAARFGDPAMELRATFESALLYQRMKNSPAVAQRTPRIKALLQSPAVPREVKLDIESRTVK